MPLTNPVGTPLIATKERRDEMVRCIRLIGWTLPMLSERLGQAYTHGARLNQCKADLADSDLAWLQELAVLVASKPRPEIVRTFPDEALTVTMAPPVEEWTEAEAGTDEEETDMEMVASHLADVYLVARSDPELTHEQREGAAWAVSEMMERLGVVERCREKVRNMAAHPLGMAPLKPEGGQYHEDPLHPVNIANEARLKADLQRQAFADADP
jgi:hypothetical protein